MSSVWPTATDDISAGLWIVDRTGHQKINMFFVVKYRGLVWLAAKSLVHKTKVGSYLQKTARRNLQLQTYSVALKRVQGIWPERPMLEAHWNG
jgi:hypothetical protein